MAEMILQLEKIYQTVRSHLDCGQYYVEREPGRVFHVFGAERFWQINHFENGGGFGEGG